MSDHAVVTGGASGIGLSTVRRLAARGAAVSVFDLDPAALERMTLDLGPSVRGVAVDVADADAVAAALEEAAREAGTPDHLVACAGIKGQRVPALAVDTAAWKALMDVHLFGTWAACRSFAELHRAAGRTGGASIVTVSSIVAANAFTTQLDYGTAKVAIEHLTKVLAVEWAPLGIRVNAVAPGFTATPMVAAMQAEGYDLSPVERRTPMGRLAHPDETAAAIEFLSYDAGFVTGVILPVDGGWTAVGR